MARTKLNQRSANRVAVPMGATGGRTPPSKISVAILATSIVAASWAAAMMTPYGRVAYVYVFMYSEYFMGVLTLVALSVTVMLGLVATDRLVLSIRQRVLLQSAHRTTGVIAVAALFIHIATKLSIQHITVLDIFVPFMASFNTVYVGLGTLAGWFLVSVLWTGLARAKFAGRGKPWMWRSLHSTAYLAWPIALVHGLSAGRPAATWVIVSYVICVLGVLVGLAVRLSVSLNRKKDFSSTATGGLKPVGSLVPTQAPAPKKRTPRRREAAVPEPAGVAPDTWVPAAGARASMTDELGPISGRPISGAPMSRPVSPSPMPSRPVSAPMTRPVSAIPYDEVPVPRSRRYAEEEPPRRRRADADHYDEPTRSISRRAMDDEAPMPRGRRRAEIEEPPAYVPEPPARPRRYAEDDDYAPRPRRAIEEAPRARRYADDDEPAPRGRRYAEDDEPPRGRRYAEERYDEAPRLRHEPDARTTGEFRTGGIRYDEALPAPRRSRSSRYAEDEAAAPRARRDRGADVDRADSGRHSRSEFVDLAEAGYPEPDDTPTLVDIASRRARKAAQQDTTRTASRGARKGGRGRNTDDALDDQQYWRQLRGEAQ